MTSRIKIVMLALNSVDAEGHQHGNDGKFVSKSGGLGSDVAVKFKAAAKKASKDPRAMKFNEELKKAKKNKDAAGIVRIRMAAIKSGMVWDKSIKGYRPSIVI